MSSQEIFSSKASAANEAFTKLSKDHRIIATIRVILFLTAVILIIFFANMKMLSGIAAVVLLFPLPFGLLVKRHNKVAYDRDQAKYIKQINEQELQILKGDLGGLREGAEFIDKTHPYAYDLDVFGRNSLYQLVNRSSTPSGAKILANWLKNPVKKDKVAARQEAVKELREAVDWRQEFQASGMHEADEKQDVNALVKWLEEPPRVMNDSIIKAVSFILPTITIGLLLFTLFTDLSFYYVVGMLAINGWVLKKYLIYIQDITNHTAANMSLLKSYGALIKMIEDSSYSSSEIQKIQHEFKHDEFKASQAMLKLQKTLDFLNGRANMFYLFLNSILLFDIHLLLATEKWKKNNKANVSHWFEAIGQLEALCSLAGFSYSNPGYIFPVISDKAASIKVKSLGHPLILNQERVTNNLDLENTGTIALITGSNMSGKSTFLRTVGVNVVLGLCGAPVCAKEAEISYMQVFTGMRTEDNLEEHVSSFYAELKRIQSLLKMVENEEVTILFMLDEILKGTNSKDRHKGAAALIRQLAKTNSFGFVSTHDLELGDMEQELPGVKNYSFNSSIEGDEIIFNYRLEKGLCRSFNASKLMEKIGIDMSNSPE